MILSLNDVVAFLDQQKPDIVKAEIAGLGEICLRRADFGESMDFGDFANRNPNTPATEMYLRTICNHWCDDKGKLLFTFAEHESILRKLPFEPVKALFDEACKLVPKPDKAEIEKKSEASLTLNS